MRKLLLLVIAASLCFLALPTFLAPAKSQVRSEKYIKASSPIPGSFIVVLSSTKVEFSEPEVDKETPEGELEEGEELKGLPEVSEPNEDEAFEPIFDDITLDEGPPVDSKVASTAQELVDTYGGAIEFKYGEALHGFSMKATVEQAQAMSADSRVLFVEEDSIADPSPFVQFFPPWGLDRIDQRFLPLNNQFRFNNTGLGVNIYIIDTGVRFNHVDFNDIFQNPQVGRAFLVFDATGGNGQDCNGHGTHVAGTAAGSRFGVAKRARIFSVRVFGCAGGSPWAVIINGVNFVSWHRRQPPFIGRPAVANMSLGGPANLAADIAVQNSIARNITYAVAAGNSNANAVFFSPARVPQAITVGATDRFDFRAGFSNFGASLDLFAPGVNIPSDWFTTPTATRILSGTSMASPHAAGVAALILQGAPGLNPIQVRNVMVANSTAGVVINPGPGSPNRLLFTNY